MVSGSGLEESLSLAAFSELLDSCSIKRTYNMGYGRYGCINIRTREIYLNAHNTEIDNIETVVHEIMHLFFATELGISITNPQHNEETIEKARILYMKEYPDVVNVVRRKLGLDEVDLCVWKYIMSDKHSTTREDALRSKNSDLRKCILCIGYDTECEWYRGVDYLRKRFILKSKK